MAEPGGAACVGVSPSHSCQVNGRYGNLQVILLACLARRAAAPGESTFKCLDDTVPAMNQKNGFAGCGLGHSSKCVSWSSLPTTASSPASPLARHAVQCSGDSHLRFKPFPSLTASVP